MRSPSLYALAFACMALTSMAFAITPSDPFDFSQICFPSMTGSELLKSRNLSLKGKTVVLDGGTKGIGFGIATAIASAGAKLIMLGYHEESAKASIANITAATGNHDISLIAPFDLASFKSIDSAIAKVNQMTGTHGVDVLVCDAGLDAQYPGIPAMTEDGFEVTFQVTFLGHFRLTEQLLPLLQKANGRVVHTGSTTNGFHNLSYMMSVFEDETQCKIQASPENCTTIPFLEKALRKQAVPNPGTFPPNLPSNAFFAHFFKTFYSYEFNSRNNGVSMYTGHPGAVLTTQSNITDPKLIKEICTPPGWMYCLCVKDSSFELDMENCALTIAKGSASNAWLTAAPKNVLDNFEGSFFGLCSPLPAPADQFKLYAQSAGQHGAIQYAKDLSALWSKWAK